MGRGRSAAWSVLLGLPLLAGGLALHTADRYLQSLGQPVAALGGFVVVMALVVHLINPSPPTFRAGETVLDERRPNPRPAVMKAVSSVPFFVAAGYLLYYTRRPYAYPTAAFFLGLYLYSGGLLGYWQNALTSFHLTDQRLVKVYRFLSLERKEIAMGNVQMIQERKSIWETLVGLGNVRVAAGVEDLEIVARNIREASSFAEAVRDLSVPEVPGRAGPEPDRER